MVEMDWGNVPERCNRGYRFHRLLRPFAGTPAPLTGLDMHPPCQPTANITLIQPIKPFIAIIPASPATPAACQPCPTAFSTATPRPWPKALLGKVIRHRVGDLWLAARIIETEAYYLRRKRQPRLARLHRKA
jgi:hypothetical protein